MRNFEFLTKQGPRIDRILARLVAAFFLIIVGIACGYAWAIKAYGIKLLN